jgi:hypothetical protein
MAGCEAGYSGIARATIVLPPTVAEEDDDEKSDESDQEVPSTQ